MRKHFVFILLSICILTSCGDNKKNSLTATDTTSNTAEKPAAKSDSKEPRANIRLVLGGGDMAGSYEAVCHDACCSYGVAGDKIFGNQYSETGKGPKELSSVQLMVEGVTTGTKNTDQFLVTVSFGDILNSSKSFTIDTRKGSRSEGQGTIEVQYSNDKATVKLRGKTKEGVQMDLDMECHKVITTESIMKE